MANKLLLKKSSVASRVPTTSDLTYGELALNYQDGKLYYKTAGNTIDYFASGAATPTLQAVTTAGASSSNQITLSGAGDNTTTYSSLRFSGYNQGGGTGYHGFFEVQNTYPTATNPKKFFRLDSSGQFQIINSGYTANIFNLTDAGDLTIPGALSVGGNGITYNGATSGNIVLKATSTAGTNTITLPAASGTVALTTDIISQKRQEYTATAGQTTFTVTNGYTIGAVQVFANGIALASSDYTATNGTTVVLNDPRVVGDNIIIWGGGAIQGNGGVGQTTNDLTVGTGLQYNTGTTFNGSVAKTISLTTSGATAGTYGNSYVSGAYLYLPQLTVDAYGRVTAISHNLVSFNQPRASYTTTTLTSIAPDASSYDQINFTALATAITINAHTGTPADGNNLTFRFLDNGTARAITWNAAYVAIGVTLPTTTVANKTTYVKCVYNSAASRWDVVRVNTQA